MPALLLEVRVAVGMGLQATLLDRLELQILAAEAAAGIPLHIQILIQAVQVSLSSSTFALH